jgi:hypothetical protein
MIMDYFWMIPFGNTPLVIVDFRKLGETLPQLCECELNGCIFLRRLVTMFTKNREIWGYIRDITIEIGYIGDIPD